MHHFEFHFSENEGNWLLAAIFPTRRKSVHSLFNCVNSSVVSQLLLRLQSHSHFKGDYVPETVLNRRYYYRPLMRIDVRL